jgi:pimeloyl-ACP methyl ester carboxylesterase
MSNHLISSAAASRWRTPALIAASLAASYFYVRAKTRQVERDNPPAGKFVEVDGVKLHYLDQGEGPALVLLHGNGVIANDFQTSGLIDRAAQHYRVISFDRPGYGYSERPRSTIWTPMAQAKLIHAALRQLGIEQPLVLGHSWGTMVAMSMGLAFPEYVRGLVLVAGYYYGSLRLGVPMMSTPAIPVIGDVLRYTVSPLLGRMMWRPMSKQMFSPLPIDAKFDRLPVWMMLRPSQLRASAAESALMVPSAMSLSKQYNDLKVPLKIIAGLGDKIVNPEHNAVRLHEDVGNSDLRLHPGVGHMAHYARPEQIMDVINALATQTESKTLLADNASDLATATTPGAMTDVAPEARESGV